MRNVVLVCLDSVRKDTFDEHAPRLDARAAVSFEQARAASSWSVPSHASILTGQLPHQHGIDTHTREYSHLTRSDTFLGDLPEHEAIGVSANVFAGEEFGFDAPFDRFETLSNVCAYPQGLDVGEFVSDPNREHPIRSFLSESLRSDHRLQSLANGGLAFLDDVFSGRRLPNVLDDGGKAVLRQSRMSVLRAEEPFVLFCNLMEAHTPLEPLLWFGDHGVPNDYTTTTHGVWDLMDDVESHEEYVRHWRALYAAAVEYLDRLLASFVDWLQSRTDLPTTVVLTADHGENLGYDSEEGFVRHKSSLSEGLLHVPLAVVNPPDADSFRTDRFVSHLDLGRLLVGFATERCPDVTRERIPAEVMGMSAGPEPPSNRSYWDRAIRCAYDGDRKYVWDSLGECSRYRIDTDRPSWQTREATDVDLPEWARAFFDEPIAASKEAAAATRSDPDAVDSATKARLEHLGYR